MNVHIKIRQIQEKTIKYKHYLNRGFKDMTSKTIKKKSTAQTAENKTSSKNNSEAQYGFFENGAVWLLSRLPFTKNRYQNWSKSKRILIGILLYFICLPIIPLVIGLVLYLHDPQGFKNGNAIKVLASIIAVWAGLFGLIAMQPSTPDNPINQSIKTDKYNTEQRRSPEAQQADSSDTAADDAKSEARKSIKDKTSSEATKGRFFKNCDAAFSVGVYDIKKSDPSYQARLDRDNDGIACEK